MSRKFSRPPVLTIAQWALMSIAIDRQIAACRIIAKASGDTPYARELNDYIDIAAEIERQLNGGDP